MRWFLLALGIGLSAALVRERVEVSHADVSRSDQEIRPGRIFGSSNNTPKPPPRNLVDWLYGAIKPGAKPANGGGAEMDMSNGRSKPHDHRARRARNNDDDDIEQPYKARPESVWADEDQNHDGDVDREFRDAGDTWHTLPDPDPKMHPEAEERKRRPKRRAVAAYVFVKGGTKGFTFDEASRACQKELDPSATLCSLRELTSVQKQHSLEPSTRLANMGAKYPTEDGRGPLVTDWGWTGSVFALQNTTGEFPTWYHLSRFHLAGILDGGPRWVGSAKIGKPVLQLGQNGSKPRFQQHHVRQAIKMYSGDYTAPVTTSNAHCCSHFPKFAALGRMGSNTLDEARLKCVTEFYGHLCSLPELEQAFKRGVRTSRDRWGWTNSPSFFGNENLNYHTANLWGGGDQDIQGDFDHHERERPGPRDVKMPSPSSPPSSPIARPDTFVPFKPPEHNEHSEHNSPSHAVGGFLPFKPKVGFREISPSHESHSGSEWQLDGHHLQGMRALPSSFLALDERETNALMGGKRASIHTRRHHNKLARALEQRSQPLPEGKEPPARALALLETAAEDWPDEDDDNQNEPYIFVSEKTLAEPEPTVSPTAAPTAAPTAPAASIPPGATMLKLPIDSSQNRGGTKPGQLHHILTGSQNSDEWKGAALCCKGFTYMDYGAGKMKKWLRQQQVPADHYRGGLFQSLDTSADMGRSLPWPEASFRSRVYDNAVASIALMLTADQLLPGYPDTGDLDYQVVTTNLLTLQSLLEDWSDPIGSKTIPFAFNLEGSTQPHWKSPVYTVGTVSSVGQAFANFALSTGSEVFNRDLQAMAKWVLGRQRPDKLLMRGYNGERLLQVVATEDNLEAYFFLRACSAVLTDKLFNYTRESEALGDAIFTRLWNDTIGSFDLWLGAENVGKEKLKVLKLMARGAFFLMETGRHGHARTILDHPFWLQHTWRKHSKKHETGAGWGAVVWGEGSGAMVAAFRRNGDPTATQMLQDLWPLYTENGGVMTVSQNEELFFPYGGVAATAWNLIAQSPRFHDIYRNDYNYTS